MATELSGLSIYTIASDGSTVEFPLRFASGTLRDSYVRVSVEGEVDGEGNRLFRSFTKVPGDAGMIRISGTAPAAGLLITFQRIIPKDDLLHKYSNGSILNYPSLDESHMQLLMAIQELMDGFGFQNISTDLDMNNRDILNVGKLTLQDFGTGVGPSFQELLTQANTQLALNQAEVAKAKLQADAAAASAVQASGFSGAAAMSATAAQQSADSAAANSEGLAAEVQNLSTMLIGAIFPLTCTDSYVPNGCVPANGGEYTRAQFPSLYDTYLVGGKLLTCTYAEQAAQVALTGNCAKFALDTTSQKFKVPLLKDGDSITQASSASEIGKSVKAGLPNVYGTTVTDEQIRLRHFVVVASAQNNASVFDWSNYMAGLTGKLNADFSNAPQNRPYIIDSWESANRGIWYKKWSDGLIEQGIAGNGGAAVTFPTPFLRSDKTRFYKPGLFSSNPAAYSPTFIVQSDSLTGAVVSARIDGVNNAGLYWTFEVSGY